MTHEDIWFLLWLCHIRLLVFGTGVSWIWEYPFIFYLFSVYILRLDGSYSSFIHLLWCIPLLGEYFPYVPVGFSVNWVLNSFYFLVDSFWSLLLLRSLFSFCHSPFLDFVLFRIVHTFCFAFDHTEVNTRSPLSELPPFFVRLVPSRSSDPYVHFIIRLDVSFEYLPKFRLGSKNRLKYFLVRLTAHPLCNPRLSFPSFLYFLSGSPPSIILFLALIEFQTTESTCTRLERKK